MPDQLARLWTADQFDAFTTLVLDSPDKAAAVAERVILLGADPEVMRAMARAAAPYVGG